MRDETIIYFSFADVNPHIMPILISTFEKILQIHEDSGKESALLYLYKCVVLDPCFDSVFLGMRPDRPALCSFVFQLLFSVTATKTSYITMSQ